MASNHDIQATHHLIHLFEQAKSQTEFTLDTFPGLFCVINYGGSIFRGNDRLAEIFGVEHEHLLDQNFKDLFTPQTWEKFANALEKILEQSADSKMEFELDLDGIGSVANKNYVWNLMPLQSGSERNFHLVKVIGRDVTELKRATSVKARIEAEIELTSAVQKMFLPKSTQIDTPKFRISGFYRPATACGGDWWWCRAKDNDHAAIFVGDVTGHGANSAMITATVAACFKAFEKSNPYVTVPELMRRTHEVFYDFTGGEYYMPSLGVALDFNSRIMTCWSAAAPNIYLVRPGEKTEAIGTPGSPIGFEVALTLGEFVVQFKPKDRIFIATDGISEVRIPGGRFLGERRLAKILENAASQTGHAITKFVIDEIDRLRGSQPQDDDFTFVGIEIL